MSLSYGNNQHESPDYQNKGSDFNPRSDYRNNTRSSESSDREIISNSDNRKASSEFYFYKNPTDNSVERVELRSKPSGLNSNRRVEELRDSHPSRHSPSPERRSRSRLSSPLLQRRQPGGQGSQGSPGPQRRSLEVSVPQVPGSYCSNSLQRPRRVSSGSGRWPGAGEGVANSNLVYHTPQVGRGPEP